MIFTDVITELEYMCQGIVLTTTIWPHFSI
jgi:hypothetical protein